MLLIQTALDVFRTSDPRFCQSSHGRQGRRLGTSPPTSFPPPPMPPPACAVRQSPMGSYGDGIFFPHACGGARRAARSSGSTLRWQPRSAMMAARRRRPTVEATASSCHGGNDVMPRSGPTGLGLGLDSNPLASC